MLERERERKTRILITWFLFSKVDDGYYYYYDDNNRKGYKVQMNIEITHVIERGENEWVVAHVGRIQEASKSKK